MVGHDRLQKRIPSEFAALLRKAIQLDPANRYKNGGGNVRGISAHTTFDQAFVKY